MDSYHSLTRLFGLLLAGCTLSNAFGKTKDHQIYGVLHLDPSQELVTSDTLQPWTPAEAQSQSTTVPVPELLHPYLLGLVLDQEAKQARFFSRVPSYRVGFAVETILSQLKSSLSETTELLRDALSQGEEYEILIKKLKSVPTPPSNHSNHSSNHFFLVTWQEQLKRAQEIGWSDEVKKSAPMWNPTSFQFDSLPDRFKDFERLVESRLNTTYLERTRQKVFYGLMYSMDSHCQLPESYFLSPSALRAYYNANKNDFKIQYEFDVTSIRLLPQEPSVLEPLSEFLKQVFAELHGKHAKNWEQETSPSVSKLVEARKRLKEELIETLKTRLPEANQIWNTQHLALNKLFEVHTHRIQWPPLHPQLENIRLLQFVRELEINKHFLPHQSWVNSQGYYEIGFMIERTEPVNTFYAFDQSEVQERIQNVLKGKEQQDRHERCAKKLITQLFKKYPFEPIVPAYRTSAEAQAKILTQGFPNLVDRSFSMIVPTQK